MQLSSFLFHKDAWRSYQPSVRQNNKQHGRVHDCRVLRKGDRSVVPWGGGRRRESSYGHAGHQIRGSRETKPEAILGNPILGSRATSLRSARCNTVTTDNREMRCLHAAPTYRPTSRARYPFIFSFHFYSFTFHNNKCYYFLAYLFFSFPGFSFYLLLYMKFSWQFLYRNHTKKICTYKLCD